MYSNQKHPQSQFLPAKPSIALPTEMEHCALCIPSLFCLILVVSSSSPPQWKSFPNPRPSGASKAPIPKSSTALVSSSTWRLPAAPGRESSIVAEIVEVEENSTDYMQTLRRPPVITIHRSPAYAIYQLIHNIRDVAYRPVRVFCQDAKMRARCVEGMCKAFDKLAKGEANIAHCVRFRTAYSFAQEELCRFLVFGIGQRSVGFSIQIEVKVGSKVSCYYSKGVSLKEVFILAWLHLNCPGDADLYREIESKGSQLDQMNSPELKRRKADQNRKSRKQQPLYLVEGKFGCLKGVSLIEVPSFTTILKHSNFNQVDRADCQFYMTATTIDNGSQPLRKQFHMQFTYEVVLYMFGYFGKNETRSYQMNLINVIGPFIPPNTERNRFPESIKSMRNKLWDGLLDFIMGRTCSACADMAFTSKRFIMGMSCIGPEICIDATVMLRNTMIIHI
ncbi:unnamed protein product [Linum tenue]|uniref:Uncharacterized protein n=1 Tax=Linum tenue TaxID=586396 RepID=A0AAV0K1Q2_9ROSI|nr:unnamed protein product [Linum tenue]